MSNLHHVTAANIGEYCIYTESSCGAPNDRALMIYRRAVVAGIINTGDHLIVNGDLDAVLNMDVEEWGSLVTAADEKLPPVDEPEDDSKEADFTRGWNDYLNGVKWYEVELSRSRGWYAALDAEQAAQPVESVKVKPRKPYRRGFSVPLHAPRPEGVSYWIRVLGEVS